MEIEGSFFILKSLPYYNLESSIRRQ